MADFVGTMNCLQGTSHDGARGLLTGRVLSSFFLGDGTRLVVEGVERTLIMVEPPPHASSRRARAFT